MQVIKSECRRALLSLLAPSVSVVLLASIGLQSAFAGPLPVFAGVTGVETRQDARTASQVIEFKSDLPFQYQMQILDKNHVVFRLYNARLANNLLTPEGGVNLLASGAVESARLRSPEKSKPVQDEYQEIVLSGPELGTHKIQVQGATELPLMRPLIRPVAGLAPVDPAASPKKAAAIAAMDRFARRPIPPGQPVKLVGKHPAKLLPNLKTLQQDVALQKASPATQAMALMALSASDAASANATSDTASQRIEIDAPPAMKPRSAGPQIEAVTNTAGGSYPALDAANHAALMPRAFERPPEPQESIDSAPLSAQDNSTIDATSAASPEPDSTAAMHQAQPAELIPLPRYHGGAPPIQAMTLDTSGNPVVIRPKNAPIQEFNVDRRNGGYNALFQAETPEPETGWDSANRLVNEALSLYHQQQYPQAEQKIQQALQLEQSSADLYAALAEIQLKLNNREAAMQAYQQASRLSPKEYGQPYAQALVQAGKRQDAIQVLESLNQAQPRQEQVIYMLGTLYEEMGRVTPALTYLKQAAQLHPASADIQYNLGLAYELSGDREQAEKHYRQALTLSPKASDIANALDRVRK